MIDYIILKDGWKVPRPNSNEAERLEALRKLNILDTPAEESFDKITKIIGQSLGVPIALISLVDEDRQWFKSCYGIDATQTSRNASFCAHAIVKPSILHVPDALEDERYRENILVTDEPNIRFYLGAPLVTKDGYALGSLCAIDTVPRYDITVNQLNLIETLAELVMTQLELRINKQRLEDAHNSKSAFFAGMSHEIRTPMNGIMGAATLLKNAKLPESEEKYVNTILSSGRMLLEIIDEVLDFAKMESQQLTLHEIDFNLHESCTQQIELLKTIADEKDIEVTLNIDDKLPQYVFADETRIKQVLSNIIGNAIKFTDPQGYVKIDFSQDEENMLTISIADNGAGIAQDQIDNIFVAYEQILEHRKHSKSAGTGLGLAITKYLIEIMGGTIAVESEVDVGTCFTINIPLKVSELNEEDIKENQPTHILTQLDKTPEVLLVEDVITNQFIVTSLLEQIGCKVDLAENGQEALDKVQEKHYDAVFMDCHMPVMDGYEATTEIRKLSIEQPKIIAMTANAFQEDRDRCFASGMDNFISKPVDMQKVIDVLNS